MQFKEFRDKFESVNPEDVLEATDLPPVMENEQGIHSHMPPAVLMMRRVSVRQHGNGIIVAVYYIDKLNKYVTVPYSGDYLQAMPAEEVQFKEESSLEKRIDNILILKNSYNAKSLYMEVFNKLDEENKEKFVQLMREDFKTVADFVRKNI